MDHGQPYDVVIAGAGPAGCAAALALRAHALKVLLLDQKKFPRDKVCGDAIPGQALKHLRRVLEGTGEDIDALVQKQSVQTSDIYTAKGRKLTVTWNLKTFNSPRLDFDNYLLSLVKKLTSTGIREGFSVKEIRRDDKLTLVSATGETVKTNLVIGCDGPHSVVRRALLPAKYADLKQGVALRRYYRNVDTPLGCNEVFLFENGPQGYFWIFPVGNGVFNVGVGVSAMATGKTDLKALFHNLVATHPLVKEKLQHAVPVDELTGFRLPFGGALAPMSGDRFMLTGDAAYLVDPMQGHGIYTAVKSGSLAAEQALRCLQSGDFSAATMKAYDAAVFQSVGRELKRNARVLKYLYYNPWVTEAAIFLAGNGTIRRAIQKFF